MLAPLALLLALASVSGQQLLFFRPPPPPPPILPPEIILQARQGGGFRAYLPAECGIESFVFKCQKGPSPKAEPTTTTTTTTTPSTTTVKDPTTTTTTTTEKSAKEDEKKEMMEKEKEMPDDKKEPEKDKEADPEEDAEWITANVTKPEGNYWIYENEALKLNPGDVINYSAVVHFRGGVYSRPPTPWIVPNLVPQFQPPHLESPPSCGEEEKAVERAADRAAEEPEDPPQFCSSRALQPTPDDSPMLILKKENARLRCELAASKEKSVKIATAFQEELTQLKKLNYAMVAQMERLERLHRAILMRP